MRRRLLPRKENGEHGSVLLEAVIITPLLLMIMLGVFDLGMAWRSSLTVTSSARSGARVATNLGRSVDTDPETIRALAAGLNNEGLESIARIVIYRSTDADGEVPAQCLTDATLAVGGSSTYRCNVYSSSEVMAISAGSGSAPTFSTDCSSSRDRFWCPSTRQNVQAISPGPDYLGVYVEVTHQTFTKLFGQTMQIDDNAVMRIEPGAGS